MGRPRPLRRTVLFLHPEASSSGRLLSLDTLTLRPGPGLTAIIGERLLKSLDLTRLGGAVPVQIAQGLVKDQMDAAICMIDRHPIWAAIAAGPDHERALPALLAYMIESRHYLHAAVWRMAPAVVGSTANTAVSDHLAAHLVEEADHAKFFEQALGALGLKPTMAASLRPLPTTLEWIHFMRATGRHHPLIGALCSGLLESTALDRQNIRRWHEMLWRSGLIPQASAEAMRMHVDLDEGLGHGENWRRCLRDAEAIPAALLAEGLNSISNLTEMLLRWLSSLLNGVSGDAVSALIGIRASSRAAPALDLVYDGAPVWPARILGLIAHGGLSDHESRAMVGVGFVSPPGRVKIAGRLGKAVAGLRSKLAHDAPGPRRRPTARRLHAHVLSWMRAIDGHELWELLQSPNHETLVRGWILENSHYLASARQHVAAALSSCTDVLIRDELLKHFKEELHHAELLREALGRNPRFPSPTRCRPLATTTAFVGLLADLAGADWRAYVIALCFLQLTYRRADRRHNEFYRATEASNGAESALIKALQKHDAVDGAMGHEGDVFRLMRLLAGRHRDLESSLRRAMMIPQLAWGFLDGILEHYCGDESAILQRSGWVG